MELREVVDNTVKDVVAKAALKFKKGFKPSDVVIFVGVSSISENDEMVSSNPQEICTIKNYGTESEKIVKKLVVVPTESLRT